MSNAGDERSPRVTGALIGRIIAVLGFICLGTFAVMQSMRYDTQNQTAQGDDSELKIEQTSEQQQASFKPTIEANSFGTQSGFSSNPSTTQAKSSGFGQKSTDSTSSTNSFSSRPSKSLGDSNSFGVKSSTQSTSRPTPPANLSGGNTFGTGTSKPVVKKISQPGSRKTFGTSTTPPERLAQLGNTLAKPNLSETANSFGQAGKSLTNKAANNLDSALNNARNATSNAAQALKDGAANTAKSAANKTGLAVNNLRSTFGTASNTTSNTPSNATTGRRTSTNSSFGSPMQNPQTGFDGGRGLNPMANSRNTTGNTSNPAIVRSNNTFGAATTGRNTQSTLGNRNMSNTQGKSAVTPGFPSSTTPSTSRPMTGFGSNNRAPQSRSQPQNRLASSTSSAPTMMPAAIKTLPTPGDRQLEGPQAPALTIEKLAPREIQLNSPASFQIIVRNTGRVTADTVQVFDRIPAGTELIEALPQPTRSASGDVRWELGAMRPGQEKRIKFVLRPTRQGEIGSVAHVTFATQASMRTLVTKPMLEIRQSAKPTVLIGDTAMIDIVVENKGDGPAREVMVHQDVPQQLEHVEGPEIEHPIGDLAPGQSRRLQLAMKAREIGRLKNILFASAKGDLEAQHTIDMEVIAPQLQVASNGPKRRFLKREATHQFSVSNRGTAKATNVELVSRLPNGLRFVSANNRGKYDGNTHSVYWSLAELAPGIVANVELQTLPTEPGEQPISFNAMADLNQKAETQQALVVEHLIDVFFDIDDVVDPIEIGSPTAYRIRVVNQGTKTATNVRLQVDFPQGIVPQSVDGNLPNEIRGQSIVFAPITSMNPGDEIKLSVNGKGAAAGDHRVIARLQADGRDTHASKEETTRVYNDR